MRAGGPSASIRAVSGPGARHEPGRQEPGRQERSFGQTGLAQKGSPETRSHRGGRRAGIAYGGAFEALFAILIGAGLGYWADSAFETSPIFLLVGIAAGFGSFVMLMMRLARRLAELEEDGEQTFERELSTGFRIAPVQRLHLLLTGIGIAAGWALVSPTFAGAVAIGGLLAAANFRSLWRASEAALGAGGGGAVAGFGFRFLLLAAILGVALHQGIHPVGLVLGFSLIMPAAIAAAWQVRPKPDPEAEALPPEDAEWDNWDAWRARERDDEDDE